MSTFRKKDLASSREPFPLLTLPLTLPVSRGVSSFGFRGWRRKGLKKAWHVAGMSDAAKWSKKTSFS